MCAIKRRVKECVLAVLLLYEGVGNGLHAVLRTDEDDSRPSTHNEAKLPGVLC